MKYREELAGLPLLDGLTEEEFALVAGRFSEEQFPAGTPIVEQGYGGFKLYVLMEGRIRVYRTLNGSKVLITTMEKPETFGELSIIDGAPTSATVEAESDAVALTLHRDDFYEILESSAVLEAKIWKNLLRTLCSRLRSTTNQVQDYFAINKALCENESFRSFYKLFYS
jgi:CRP-like cAMP-binding protein